MAIYIPRTYGGRGRTRMWIYIISAVLVIGVGIAILYGNNPFGRQQEELPPPVSPVEADTVGATSKVGLGAPTPQPQVRAEVNLPATTPVVQPTPVPVAPEVVTGSSPEAGRLISEAMALLQQKPGSLIPARSMLNESLPLPMSQQQQEFVKKQMSTLADTWLFSRSVFPQDPLCSSYKVKAGDLLMTIGEQFKVPYEILMQINNIARPEALKAGETIKVINGPFHVKVYRSTFMMDLYLQNTYVRSFRVGLGKPGMETPTGRWKVKVGGKLVKPVWTNPVDGKTYRPEDADYPLGSRWIGLDGVDGAARGKTGFAIHGTHKPEEIGTQGSQGCIRLHNGDAVLVYNLLMPGYSEVVVQD